MPHRPTVTLAAADTQISFERFELCVAEGPDVGLCRAFGQERVQIGTARSNDFVLTDRTVSRFHLRIENRDGKLSFHDMGSTNGTFVGNMRVEAAQLTDETLIRLGGTTVRFRVLDDRATISIPEANHFGPIIGKSAKMRRLYDIIERAAASDISVVLEGETGTGKDLVAHLLHDRSPRAGEPFEVLDCTAVPDNLLEAELFGHVRGAFTGAERDRPGIFERASGGTVFIDEIGEIKPELQPKLLRVLETGQIRPLGANTIETVDVRVVGATHRSLAGLVNSGQFREDLYFRLAGCRIELPPLRERVEDIPLLVEHFLSLLPPGNQGQRVTTLDSDTMRRFMDSPWPGNVRELRNAVARIAALGPEAMLLDDDDPNPTSPAGDTGIAAPLKQAKNDFERRYLAGLLARHQGDIKAAASAAGVHPKSLARLVRRYGIRHD